MSRRSSPLVPPARAVALVMAGGALGTAARYGLGQRFPVATGSFPTTTFVENVLGAALLGLLVTVLASRDLAPWWRPLLAAGVLGSFTTFSTFATEVVLLADGGEPELAAAYGTATLAAGIVAAGLGVGAAHRWLPAGRDEP